MAELWVDTQAICRNYHHFSRQGRVIPVLKEDGYGLGAQVLLPLLASQGASLFACAKPEEAVKLAGQGADLLLLSCEYNRDTLRALAEQKVILSVESLDQAKRIQNLGLPVRVHLAVDTGFGRFGFPWEETGEMKRVFYLDKLQICGIFSHFRGINAARGQFARFERVLQELEGHPLGLRHIAATSCADDPHYRLDGVRIGSGLVGCGLELEPVAQLTARICTLRHLRRGSRVGYGSTRLRRDTQIAIVDVGTGDGGFIHRGCGPRTWWQSRHEAVTVNGYRAPVLGIPGLTHTAIDVTGIPCVIGDIGEHSPVADVDFS